MILYNKTILLPDLKALNELLLNNEDVSLQSCKCIYQNRIAIKHNYENDMNSIRIWKTKSLFDYWFDDFNTSSNNFIAALDFTVNETFVKINYLNICDNIQNLDEYESEDLVKSLINFIKNIAKNENKNKVIVDVHENFKIYEKYYYYEGFESTNRRCHDNPFWIETEFILSKN